MTNPRGRPPGQGTPAVIPLLWMVALWQGLAAVAWLAGGRLWWLDLVDHLLPQTLLGAATGAVLALASGRRAWAGGFLACSIGFGARGLAARSWTSASPTGPVTRVLVANVLSANPQRQPLLELIEQEDPDVIGLLEVNPGWLTALEPVRRRWPVHLELPRADNFGIAVYARTGAVARERTLGSGIVPSLVVELPDGTRVVVTHPVPPVSAQGTARRDAQLADVREALEVPGTVVAGDLNCTPWARCFPASGGFLGGTWPSGLPAPLRIPIDHVLAGPGRAVVRRRVGAAIGSDHRPVVADVVHTE